MNYLLRRRGLGLTSCRGIASFMHNLIEIVRNDNIPVMTEDDFVIRWGCTSNIPHRASLPRVHNSPASIHACNNKRQGRLDMQAAGVPVPKTWGSIEDYDSTDGYAESLVFRPARHAQGRHLYVVKHEDGEQIEHRSHQFNSYYISELIDKVAEYRVYVVHGRVACVARKTPGNPDEIAWNVARGGRFDNVRWAEWPMAAVEEALCAAAVMGTHFCGVDVMMDENGKAYVLEANSAPSLTSAYRQQCFAKCFDWFIDADFQMPEPAGHDFDSWKDVIHPAVREAA